VRVKIVTQLEHDQLTRLFNFKGAVVISLS
jgi:hypothetical protein